MKEERTTRIAVGLASLAFLLALSVAAIVPGRAWSPGSRELAHAPILNVPRVLSVETGLAIAPRSNGVLVSTGDGGGAGLVEGLDAPVRVRASTFRGRACWEIGDTRATYVDDNGIRLDDGMTDRLRVRAWPVAACLALLAVVLIGLDRRRRGLAPIGAAVLLLAAGWIAATL